MPVFSARSPALDGVSWVQGGEVENAVGWGGRVLHNRHRRLNAHTQLASLTYICCANDINDSGEITAAAFDPTFNQRDDFVSVILIPQQGGQPISESLPVHSAAVHSSVLPNDGLQRLIPRLQGWKTAH
jgi:hypothetical protein